MALSRLSLPEPLGRRLHALALGLLIALVGMLAIAIEPVAELEDQFGLRWLFRLRGAVAPPASVVVVAIDEQSARELELPDKPRAWPRQLHAELVRYLAAAGARAIVFDLTFETPGSDAAHDEAFAAAMAQAGKVLITESLRKETFALQGADGAPLGDAVIERRVPPIPLFEQAAFGRAPFLLPKDARVNRYWTFVGSAADAPTLPVAAFHLHAGEAFADLVRLLRQAEPQLALPALSQAPPWLAVGDAPSATATARAALQGRPDTAERMLRALQQTARIGDDRARLVHAMVGLYLRPDETHLRFYGPPRSITTVPYSRVLRAARSADPSTAGGAAPEAFRGRTVFIGYSAATQGGQDRLRDDYRTVYSQASGLDLSGVEIAATAFANLVENRPLQPLDGGWQLAGVAAWGLLLGIVCRLLRPTRAVLVVAMLAALYLWTTYDRFIMAALWMPLAVPVGVQAPLALFAGVWLSYLDTRRERDLIKKAFAYFLPSAVVDQLARKVGPVTGGNRVVFGACLFTDVENYTALAERMAPDRLGELMNQYYAQLFVPVEHSEGVVVDVVGDAMVAIWARVSSDVALRARACDAALQIVQALDRFNSSAADRPPLPTRMGLHAGDMLVGSIGASGHYEYRAVGDIVNTASRIQGLNKVLGTRLLASQDTVAGLVGFATRPLGSFLLAGKVKPVAVVELMGRGHGLGAPQAALRERFAAALDAYRTRRWAEAAGAFGAILIDHGSDGPSHFYREQCTRLLANAPDEGWTPVIRVEQK